MADFSIGDAVEDGSHRALQRNGLMLVAAFFFINLISLFSRIPESAATASSLAAVDSFYLIRAAVASLVTLILSLYLVIIMVRVFVSEETEQIPDAFTRERIGFAAGHIVIGIILLLVALLAGILILGIPVLIVPASAMLMVPLGVIVAVYASLGLTFWHIYVVVEHESAWDAIQQSWTLSKGNRWSLLGISLVVVGISFGLMISAGIMMVLHEMAGQILAEAVSAFTTVLSSAIVARVYVQLTAE